MFAAQGQTGTQPDIKSAISVLRQRLGNPYGKPRPGMAGAGPQGVNPGAMTTQGGQQGVVGRGGNFQPFGQAALDKIKQHGMSGSGEIQGNGAPSTSGPIMAPQSQGGPVLSAPRSPMPPSGLQVIPGAPSPDGRSGAKPWQGGGVLDTSDPSGGRGFVPPQGADGNVTMERGGQFGGGAVPPPDAQPFGGGFINDPSGGRGFVPPDAAATAMQGAAGGAAAGAPGMPPQLLQQLQQLRGGGQASPFRSLVAGALGNQVSY